MSEKPRVNLYSLIHKAQRVHLYNLAAKIGCADAKDWDAIELEVREMIAHLKQHSQNESTFIHPLYHELGDDISVIDDEHDDLEKGLDKLETILNEKNWIALYPELNRFIAIYLLHQDEEEQMQEDILWKHFDDNRLMEVLIAFNASRSKEQTLKDIKFIIPGLSIAELTGMFRGMKASGSAVFENACTIAEDEMDQTRWNQLQSSISST